MSEFVTDADTFADGDAAIEHAQETMQDDTPLDALDEDAIRAELAMLDAVLEWEKPRHAPEISSRQTALRTALDHDHFDAFETDRKGARYLDDRDNLVVLDGAHWVNEAVVTHYHYVVVNRQTGEIDRPTEARDTLPDDEDTHWITVEELDALVDEGTVVPATTVPLDGDVDGEALAAVAGALQDYWGAGCSPAAALDHLMTERGPFSQREWSDRRGTSIQAISKNAGAAREALDNAE